MCQFFSFNTHPSSPVPFYFDWAARQALLKSNPYGYDADSHASIAAYLGLKEDECNKFEYDPLTGKFRVDQINGRDNSAWAEEWARALDFKTVVESLIIKPIIHPFRDIKPRKRVTERDRALLREWASVGASVGASVRASFRGSVGHSVWDSVWTLVYDSVGASFETSFEDSINGYLGSFFALDKWKYVKHAKGKYPFQPVVDLWERGLVPSFYRNVWRLRAGPDGKSIFETKGR